MTTKLYELWHFKIGAEDDFDDDEDMKLIGIYSAEDNARAAIERLRIQPGFKDWPDGFRIFTRTLDETSWEEGFIKSIRRRRLASTVGRRMLK
jgi:homoserine kinase type II